MEQRKILLSLARVEMRRQELRQQAKEVSDMLLNCRGLPRNSFA